MADTKISALTAATTPLAGTEVLPIVQSSTTVKVSVANLTNGRNTGVAKLMVNNTGGTPAVGVDIYNESGRVNAPIPGGTSREWPIWKGSQRYDASFSSGVVGIYMYSGSGYGQDGALRFKTSPNDVAEVTALEISKDQNTTFYVGNIIQGTAAKGVNFTANTPAAGMTSQLLNWYEEGTWTPVLNFGGATTGITYVTQSAKYTRVGNVVNFSLAIYLSSKGSATGSATITGLPYSKANDSIATPAAYYGDRISALTARVNNNSSTIALSAPPSGPATTVADIQDTDFANTTYLTISGQYAV